MAVDAQRPTARAATTSRPRPKREREEEVLVWPDLVFIEFIAAVLFTITFLILSVMINAPLLNRANPDVTPNPSKAPWYFLNLQELLLHMDKAWAGVLLPTIALGFFASIPYIDRSRGGQGVWFGTKYSVRLAVVAAVYTVFVLGLLVAFDAGEDSRFEYATRWVPSCDNAAEHAGLPCLKDQEGAAHTGFITMKDISKRLQFSIPFPKIFGTSAGDIEEGSGDEVLTKDGWLDWPEDVDKIPVPFNNFSCCYGSLHLWEGMNLNLASIMAEQVLPLLTIAFFTILILYALFRIGWLRTKRDVFIVMFTAVVTIYFALSLVGSFFRGEAQALIWPWEVKVDEG
ncbi:MAG: hypothetical protein IH957_05200 [Chloroflexi bacterium]|nr:hypothetical protein [Chloroflexota bacterium]